jgi:titin
VLIHSGASGNRVGWSAPGAGNVVAFNAKGVVVGAGSGDAGAVGNAVLGNAIFAIFVNRGGIGIDLGGDGPTANGANPRAFPNRGQNAPVLAGAAGGVVTGYLASAPNATFRLEFYSTPPGGPARQGRAFRGAVVVRTGPAGRASFAARLAAPPGHVVTATATNLATWDTSELCAAVLASPAAGHHVVASAAAGRHLAASQGAAPG